MGSGPWVHLGTHCIELECVCLRIPDQRELYLRIPDTRDHYQPSFAQWLRIRTLQRLGRRSKSPPPVLAVVTTTVTVTHSHAAAMGSNDGHAWWKFRVFS